MTKVIRIKKGLDIKLHGKAEKIFKKSEQSKFYALKPTDFHNVTPKMLVKEGEEVEAGSPLFKDKYREEIILTSPVSGKVAEIVRGERRKILEVLVEPNGEIKHKDFGAGDPKSLSREEIIEKLVQSGVWPFVRQRPYAIIANPKDTPKSIFIPCFDNAPLAPDYDFVVKGEDKTFQTGLDVLSKLTTGKIHLTYSNEFNPSNVFTRAKGVEHHYFSGPHPASSVGVQIHNIDPINKGDKVWYLYPQDVITIGRLFEKGIFDASRIVALTGSEVEKPIYYKTFIGACVNTIHENKVADKDLRFISGNVLTGTQVEKDGYLSFYDTHMTIIPEGNYYEMFGWALPGFKKFSTSRTFFSWLTPNKHYSLDTNYHGGERAFVMTGEYEKVLPMDILPIHLLKAIMVEDIDKMEQLGIYEIAEEDMALCEFVCTSKTEVQQIIRKGIDLMIKELG
jgi:Na+-transporting NADH:ubiquinone oxidoreductase subunit A